MKSDHPRPRVAGAIDFGFVREEVAHCSGRTVITKLGFVRTSLAVGAAIPILAGSGAFAQEPSPASLSPAQPPNAPGAATLPGGDESIATQETGGVTTERIIVTGSYIPTAQELGPNPILNINRDLINKSGSRTAEALIKDLPIANGGGVPISNNATGFTPGASAVSLRGLGADATLVLIDSRRVAPYPIGAGGTTSFFDLRSIPEAAIESIEVLTDGASATYGADAVAGVVNIKLRKDYRGAEVTLGYGNTLDKDSGELRASVVFGVGDDNTNVTGVMNYYHRNSIFNRDRGYSARPPFLSSNSTPENLQLTYDAVVEAGGTPPPGFGPTGNEEELPSLFFGHSPFRSNGASPAADYTYTASRSSFFNFNQYSSSFPQLENYGGFVDFSHKIYGPQMVLFGTLYYENTSAHDELAPGATGDFTTPGSVFLAIPPSTPNPGGDATPTGLGGPTYAETGVPPGAFNPFNPFNQIISGSSRARLLEFGNRLFDNTTDAFLSTIGLSGDKLFDGTWGYDSAFRYSNVKVTSTGTVTSTSRYNQILNQNDPIFQPGGVLAGRPAFNPFGDGRVVIPANLATVAYATVHLKDLDTSELATIDLNVYTTELFKLPAGGVGFAFGAQFRKEQLTQDVDQLSIDGDVIGQVPIATTQAGRKDWAVYAETSIPIFSPTYNIPGFYSLEITGAGRFEEFRNNDTNVAVPKVGMRWQPFDETLTVRATWGEGFLEPSLLQLYASPTSALGGARDILPGPMDPVDLGGPPVPVGDPARIDLEEPIVFSSTPTLQPEDSRSFSGGIVYSPKYVNGLTLTVDLFDIERTGVVVQSSTSDILKRELAGAAGTGQGLLPGEIVQRGSDGFITRIFTPFINSGSLKAVGADFGVQYVFQTSFGTFTSLTNATYLESLQFAGAPGATEQELAGLGSDDGYLKWRAVSRLDWTWNGLDIIGTCRYNSGLRDRKPDGRFHYISQTWFFDVQGSYDFTFVAPVGSAPLAGYSKDAKDVATGKDGRPTESSISQTSNYSLPFWQRVLNGTTITLGCDDVFGEDPPKAYGFGGSTTGYPGFLYDATGRFVYVKLTKKF